MPWFDFSMLTPGCYQCCNQFESAYYALFTNFNNGNTRQDCDHVTFSSVTDDKVSGGMPRPSSHNPDLLFTCWLTTIPHGVHELNLNTLGLCTFVIWCLTSHPTAMPLVTSIQGGLECLTALDWIDFLCYKHPTQPTEVVKVNQYGK